MQFKGRLMGFLLAFDQCLYRLYPLENKAFLLGTLSHSSFYTAMRILISLMKP